MTDPAAKPRRTCSFNGFTVDLERGCLRRGAEELKLRPKVFAALEYLVLNSGRLVTKDELIRTLWSDSFVTDDSLVQCLVELRRALGDEAAACIRTVPRRGYIFTAAVSDDAVPPPTLDEAAPAPGRGRRRSAVAAAVFAVAAVAVSWHVVPRPAARTTAFTDKAGVVIADFVNTTGDEVFDGTLRQAMAVQLGQSPFIDVFSEEQVRETLRYMGRSPDERVTRELGREIAQRRGVEALLAGSISSLGRHYVIGLEAVDAATGETMVREQVEAESRERVLGRLGQAAAKVRETLGESLASLERFAAPIEQATTHSLDAFKAYDLGRQKHFGGRYFEAIPLYRRAVELDPGFAIAHAALGITYGTAREYDQAARFSQRAFELSGRVSERERFYISTRYYMDVLGDADAAVEVLELWKETYPRDFVPRTNLAARYCAVGQHERGLQEAREGLRLNPAAGVAYAAVAHGSICLGRFGDARAAIEQAAVRALETPYGRYMLYGIAFLEGDAKLMEEQVERVAGEPTEPGMLAMQSMTAAYAGQVRRARGLTRRAVDLALSRDQKEGAGLYSAGDALWEAAYGHCGEAKRAAAGTLAVTRGREALSWAALALAMCGEAGQVRRIADDTGRRFPRDSFSRALWRPLTRAALDIGRHDPASAIERLRPAARVELGTNAALWPAYLRGLAYLDLGAAPEARAEFEKILRHRGVLAPGVFNPSALILYPLAQLGRARAAERAGDVVVSRRDYEALLALWKDADADLPALRAAQREYRRLAEHRRAQKHGD